MKDPADGVSPLYKLLGTLHSVFCHYRPEHKHWEEQFSKSVMFHPLQWCVALLDWDATMQHGGLTLVHLDGSSRRVEDSLETEMTRMGMHIHGCSVTLRPEPMVPWHEGQSKAVRIVEPFCDSLVFTYVPVSSMSMNSAHVHRLHAVDILHSQGVAVNLYVLRASLSFSKMLKDIHCLWMRSFHMHAGYVFVSERQQIKRKF